MANNFISFNSSYYNAKYLKDQLSDDQSNDVGYIFIGNSIPTANSDTDINGIENTIRDEKSVWDTMFAAKKLFGVDTHLVIPKKDWTSNTIYKQYDDIVEIEDFFTSSNSAQPIYVITDEFNVYKCLFNNLNSPSTNKPTGNYNNFNGYIKTSDGYLWKYMYNIRPTNKFLTIGWMPVPSSIYQIELESSPNNAIDKILSVVVVENSGNGYIDSTITLTQPYTTGCTILSVSNTSNIFTNMSISGTGISSGTFLINVDKIYNTITLSYPTTSSNVSNTVNCFTRVVVGGGDGNNDVVFQSTLQNTGIQKIDVTTFGTNYSKGNLIIYGSGTGANARIVFPPKYGHGFNPAKELGSKTVFISKLIGEIDSTEGGLISSNTSFRQFGLLLNPHNYGEITSVSFANANSVISQTHNVNLLTGPSYTINELVYQGQSSNKTFTGIVHSQTSNQVRLIKVSGQLANGSFLIGETSLVSRIVIGYKNPDLEPYSGDIFYVENISKVERNFGQAENIRFFINF